MADYREFLRALNREGGCPVLFEPFPPKRLVSQILWRAGDSLWDTAAHRVETLISFYSYIRADTAAISACGDIGKVLDCAYMLPDGMKFTVISDDKETLSEADSDNSVCALCTGAQIDCIGFQKPVIYISSGGADDIMLAIRRGVRAVYVPSGIEALWEQFGDRITLIGGISDSIASSAPAKIHRRIKNLYESTHGKAYILASGITEGDADYLGFISMLHMYNTLS